jgi:hypothetical protein
MGGYVVMVCIVSWRWIGLAFDMAFLMFDVE